MRMCLGCGEMKPKRELLRIVKNRENDIFIDESGKKSGRGAYICKTVDCFEKICKNNRLEKSFEIEISDDIYKILKLQVEEINE